MPLLIVQNTYAAGTGRVRGEQAVAAEAVSAAVTFSGPSNASYFFQCFPSWNTTCWYDPATITAGSITVYFSNAAPTGGGTLKWLVDHA